MFHNFRGGLERVAYPNEWPIRTSGLSERVAYPNEWPIHTIPQFKSER